MADLKCIQIWTTWRAVNQLTVFYGGSVVALAQLWEALWHVSNNLTQGGDKSKGWTQKHTQKKVSNPEGLEKATVASAVCQDVRCACVTPGDVNVTPDCHVFPPRARWGSLHVEPLDITVSSVNWPLAPGHFTLGVNDVFTPLHNKQHTPRVHRLTKEIWLCFGCSERKIRICKMTLKLYTPLSIMIMFSHLEDNSGLLQLGCYFCSFVYPSLSVMITLLSPKCGNTSLQQSDEQKTQLVNETTV